MAFIQFRRDKKAGKFRKMTATKAIVKKAVRKATKSAFARKVLAVVNRREETKYRGEWIYSAQILQPSAVVPGNLYRALPSVTQGDGDHQRIGDSIQPTKARVVFTVGFNTQSAYLVDQIVNIYLLRAKGATTAPAVAALPAHTLLKVGNGTNRDADDPNQQFMVSELNRLPINTDQFTVMKHFQFRMAKGLGFPNSAGPPGGGDSPTTITHQPIKYLSYTYKPPTLKYNEAGDQLPTNHYPVWCAWVTNVDGSTSQAQVYISVRGELYFKDA